MVGSKKDGDKIANNPSTANLAAMLPFVDGMAAASGFLKLLGMSPEAISELQQSAQELKDQASILTLPDEFNAQFANQGWIATGAMSPEVMGGLEATRMIRQIEKETHQTKCQIIALTANSQPSDTEACLAAGMDDFLAKPFRRHELFAKIERQFPAGQ